MKKRGQVTTFMIVGLVILILFVLLFSIKDSLLEAIYGPAQVKQTLNSVVDEINNKIQSCVDSEAPKALTILGKQGGSFNPTNFRNYKNDKIAYLCFKIPDTDKCSNSGLTKLELENELNNYLTNIIKNCINIEAFRNDQKYKMNVGNFDFKTIILDKLVVFNITYPITLERKGIEVKVYGFSKNVDSPIGKIQTAVVDILNTESEIGDFDDVMYMLSKRNEFVVIKERPYPDKIYVVTQKDSKYEFQFAVKG